MIIKIKVIYSMHQSFNLFHPHICFCNQWTLESIFIGWLVAPLFGIISIDEWVHSDWIQADPGRTRKNVTGDSVFDSPLTPQPFSLRISQ